MVGLGVVVEDLLLAWLGKLGRLWKSSWGAEEGRRISSPSTWGYRVHLQYCTQRIYEYISDRRDSTPCVFQTFAHPTSPCSVCRILQLPDCLTEQAAREVGWANVWKSRGVLSPSITNVYSLFQSVKVAVVPTYVCLE